MMLEGVLVGAFDDDQVVVRPVRTNLLHQVTEARDLEHIRLKLVAERRHLLIIGELGPSALDSEHAERTK